MVSKIHFESYENHSEFHCDWFKILPVLRKRNYLIEKLPIGGDQPKSFIKLYEYGIVRRNSRKKWTAYIAKFGRKWYPIESITEYLLNRIGQVLGLNMSESKLVIANKQVRFLSKYFLKKYERLVHGAEIYSNYLEDEKFIEDLDKLKMERQLISYQFAEEAITFTFMENYEELMLEFTKMLFFDALIGANDRHFYNWGIIVNIKNESSPKFAPIYDTARGLFWNIKESKLQIMGKNAKNMEIWIDNYLNKSMPKMCLDDGNEGNHFTFIEKIVKKYPKYKEICAPIKDGKRLQEVIEMIDREFSPLLSELRINMIKLCLKKRFERILRIVG